MQREPRHVCYRCHRPVVTCVCPMLPRIENTTSVSVVQHPRERLHPIGTARLAELGLSNARVFVMWDAGVRDDVRPAWLTGSTALLYPARGARDLRTLAPDERPDHLIVIDGTWHT